MSAGDYNIIRLLDRKLGVTCNCGHSYDVYLITSLDSILSVSDCLCVHVRVGALYCVCVYMCVICTYNIIMQCQKYIDEAKSSSEESECDGRVQKDS